VTHRGLIEGVGVRLAGYWDDPTWRLLRVTTFVTGSLTILLVVAYLLISRSFLYPLTTAVVINLVANIALVVCTLAVRAGRRKVARK